MRVTTLSTTDAMIRQIDALSTQQSNLQTEVSTGQKITNPEDNPAGFNTALGLENDLSELQQYGDNASQALTVAQASYSGLESLSTISNRAGELATLGTGTLGASAMQSYGTETDQLIQQAVQAANSSFNGAYLYGGTADGSPPYTVTTDASGEITGVTYVGNQTQAETPLSSSTSVAPTTDGTTNQGIATFINNLISLRDALNNGDTTGVANTQQGLTDGDNVIVAAVATNGAVQGQIQAAQTAQTSQTTNLQSDLSSLVDADLPTTVVELDQAQTAYQAALQSSVSTMQLSILNYIQ
jgi:flagellar hook-associated protein 3 FlgL